jgi:hypothetical protein
MDQQVTPKPPRVHLVMDEILDYLATTPTATSVELRDQCPSIEQDNDIHRALGNLVRDGRLIFTGLETSAKGQPMRRYRLSTPEIDAQLTDALHGTAALPMVTHPLSIDVIDAALASAGTSDFVIRAIDRLGEPRWQEGTMHATRLRALAASPALRSAPDVNAWLVDLASIIEELAA